MSMFKLEIKHSNQGFTLQELLVVMAIMAILLGIVTLNLVTVQNRTNLNSAILTMTAEIKQQQLKAMIGDTDGQANPDLYGIHFTTNGYTLFRGTTYSPSDTANIDVSLAPNMQFTNIQLPNQSLIFNRVSGDFYNYNASLSSVAMTNLTNKESKTLQFNRYGVLTNVN